MNKIKFKKIGSSFNHDGVARAQSVCGFNQSDNFEWLSTHSSEKEDFFFYMDDAIIYHGLKVPGIKYGWLLESKGYIQPVIDEILSDIELYRQHYKYIFTTLIDLVKLGPPFAYVISNAVPYIPKERRQIYPKSRDISMLVSNNTNLPGHKYRMEYLQKNVEYVDLYGRGFNWIDDVADAMIEYMFTVSMENVPDDMSFTERLTNPMVVGTVPVYWGSRMVVEKYFDKDGVLFAEEIDLKDLNKDLYNQMMPHIINNFKIASNDIPLPEDFLLQSYLLK